VEHRRAPERNSAADPRGFCAGRSVDRRPAEFTVRGAAHPQAAEAGTGGAQPPARAPDEGRAGGRAGNRGGDPAEYARALPLTDPGFVQRLREWFATVQPAPATRLWDIKSEDTARSWIAHAVTAAARDGVTFSIRPVTPKTFRDSFAMHPVQAPGAAESHSDPDGA